jgi:hypothetical protein
VPRRMRSVDLIQVTEWENGVVRRVEDRIVATVLKGNRGHAVVTASSAIAPGEYAVAFRPIDKSKKFAGDNVGRHQGEGLLFNYAWSFSVK